MKFVVSVIALAVALGWPAVGEAQSSQTKAKARSQTSTQQPYVQRHVRAGARQNDKPCAARTPDGCVGWDPDPNVRTMLQLDAGRDHQ
jgi:hypothetical protein